MAVYTALLEQEIKQFVESYGVGVFEGAKPIEKGIENTNYMVSAGGQKYILTVFESRVNADDLPFYVNFTSHLAAQGIACPKTLGLKPLKGKTAALITFLEGTDTDVIEDFHIAELGTLVAKMHVAASSFKEVKKNNYALSKWVELFKKVGERADELQPGLTQKIADELMYLAANWPFGLPSGVVHTDLFPDNVFFNGGKASGVIDFYFSCSDYFAYDIAICACAWGFETNVWRTEIFLKNYQQIRPLAEPELMALPVLLRGAAMRFLSTRLYDWFNTPEGALVKKKDPMEYVRKLESLAS